MTEKWETNLLREAEGLKYLLELFQGIDGLLAKFTEEYGEYVDPTLLMAVECLQYDVATIAEGSIVLEDKTVKGIVGQLDTVMDEVKVLQAGLPTKKGISDEDCEEDNGREEGDEA